MKQRRYRSNATHAGLRSPDISPITDICTISAMPAGAPSLHNTAKGHDLRGLRTDKMQTRTEKPGTSELAIRLRCHRAEIVGKSSIGHKETRYITWYETAWSRNISPAEWLRMAEEAIERERKQDLLKHIEDYCRQNCVWLKKESEQHEYAVDVLCSRSYEHWGGFIQGEKNGNDKRTVSGRD